MVFIEVLNFLAHFLERTGLFAVDVIGDLGLQGWLIIATLGVSLRSYRSQKRAGIREAIEQLDRHHMIYRMITENSSLNQTVQTKAGLANLSRTGRKTKISFFSNKIGSKTDLVVGHSVPPYYLTLPEQRSSELRTLEERIMAHDKIESVDRDESQITVTCSTANPVECRGIAEYVLSEFDYTVRNQIHHSDFRPYRYSSRNSTD